MREVVIASSVRTPVGRAYKGTLRTTRPDELAAVAIKGALERVPQLDAKEIEDVILGCAMPEAEQGMNVARIASLRAGLPVEVSALTINRFCSSGLQAIAMAAERIMSGGAEVIVAGGTESMTMIPMGGHKISPNPWLVDHYPDAYLNMGLTAERVAQRFGITREAADEFSLRSHQKALAAIQAGKFDDEVVPVPVSFTTPNGSKPKRQEIVFKMDEGPRADTSLEALLALEARVPRERHCDGRKFFADVRWRGGRGGHVCRTRESTRHQAAGPLRFIRHRGIQAGRNGTWPGLRDSESFEDGRAEAFRDRCDRVERSFRRAVAGRNQGSRSRSGKSKSQRRSDRSRTSAGLHGSQADGNHHSRTQAPQRTLRHGDYVRRRGHGRGGDLRESVVTVLYAILYATISPISRLCAIIDVAVRLPVKRKPPSVRFGGALCGSPAWLLSFSSLLLPVFLRNTLRQARP